MKFIETPDNIKPFLSRCEKIYGKYSEEIFSIEIFNYIQEYKMTSPIEQAMFIALETLRRINNLDQFLKIHPQFRVDKYRADFALFYSIDNKEIHIVIIECDSQEFHERSEQERRYEKARDRYFVKHGYKVFHYTGKEILENPFAPASEAIESLLDSELEDIYGSIVNFDCGE
jgi:very-short-patch-repair endonuclease